MKKRSTLLKVISILLIIFGAFGTLGTFLTAFMMQAVSQSPELLAAYEAAGVPQIGVAYYIFSILVSLVEIAAGITGVMYRSKKSVLIAGSVWLVLIVISLIWSIVLAGFQITAILSFILPVLYFWGWYQSN